MQWKMIVVLLVHFRVQLVLLTASTAEAAKGGWEETPRDSNCLDCYPYLWEGRSRGVLSTIQLTWPKCLQEQFMVWISRGRSIVTDSLGPWLVPSGQGKVWTATGCLRSSYKKKSVSYHINDHFTSDILQATKIFFSPLRITESQNVLGWKGL